MAEEPARRGKDVPSAAWANTEQLPRTKRVLHFGGSPTEASSADAVWVTDPALARDHLARGGFAVAMVHPAAADDLAEIARSLQEADPLVVVLLRSSAPTAEPVVAVGDMDPVQAIAWGRARHTARVESRVRQLGGAPAGDYACRGQDELVGGSEAMAGFRSRLLQVAEHDVPTLIHGACGTPLEPAARWLHVTSGRREGNFVPIDCREGAESQLLLRIFGHVRHAFPGADQAGVAAVALAQGGTLLLDGLEHASERVQRRLVELLARGTWQPVGSDLPRTSSARLVAVLRQPPIQAVMAGLLRRELMDQLSSHVIRMPTLADRREDIPDLVQHHLTQSSMRLGRPRPAVDDEVAALLTLGQWMGHDRELELVCERLVLNAVGGQTDIEQIIGWISLSSQSRTSEGLVCGGDHTLEELERRAILATLRHNNGHRRRSAAALGIGVRTLGLKLRRWKDAAIVPETL
ncbi:MAG: sigma 54-interacting transcriptional regulator [Phycisphaerales bacterium]|nr:sigma 54-interacting transcriptional regulator [Phycisphaerales bacterium]MDP7520442.1 sigma 54-interacting transcriptional regulator [Phycisphaerales bacterium]MDP7574039.1 sigma 54-interacting transcriptional regulator [Phycisphaerales bacterium]HJN80688.1 sigma 54-interacting transcriptional regulator [Phycisphaerales bacterium]